MIGIWQLILIFAIVLLLFGAGRVSKIMRELGSGVRAFKDGFEGNSNKKNSKSSNKYVSNKKNSLKNIKKSKVKTISNKNAK